MALITAMAALRPAAAEDETFGSSYITPFPSGDVYKVQIIGDDMAEGLLSGLQVAFAGDSRLDIQKKHLLINGLMRSDYADKLAEAEETLKAAPPHIVIAMLGAWDRVSVRDANGTRMQVGTPQWRAEYGARADRVLKLLKRYNIAVYWVGLPNVRKPDANEDAQMMNNVLRERIYLNGMKYIDAFAGFIDEDGGYSPFGPDVSGKIVRLRDGDGVYFTVAGNLKLAHFAERDLRRDLNQAKSDRAIPLAGTDVEQAKINPDKAKVAEPGSSGWNAKVASDKPGSAPGAAAGAGAAAQPAVDTTGEQKADNAKISLKTTNQAGREEVVTLDIVRPAIPASVVALVTRRESADKPSQMGEALVDQIAGGFMVMSTFTPAAGASGGDAQRKLSPAQTPYFRVLFKGERLTPKRGRADDVSWPRLEAAAGNPQASRRPAETGTAPGVAPKPADAAASPSPAKK